jgi:hypothetical protein
MLSQSSNKSATSLNKKYRIKDVVSISDEIKIQQLRNKNHNNTQIIKSLPADEKPENGYKISKLHCESLEILALKKYL